MVITDVSRTSLGVQLLLYDENIVGDDLILPGHAQWSKWKAIASQLASLHNIYDPFTEAMTKRCEAQLSYRREANVRD